MSIQCSICLGFATPFASIPCGHVFHDNCISQWLLTGKACPECRKPCGKSHIVRLFLKQENSSSADTSISEAASEYAQQWVEKCHAKEQECQEKQRKLEELRVKSEQLQLDLNQKSSDFVNIQSKHQVEQETTRKLKHDYFHSDKARKALEESNKSLQDKVNKLTMIKTTLNGSTAEMDQMLDGIASSKSYNKAMAEGLAACISAQKKVIDGYEADRDEMEVLRVKERSFDARLHAKDVEIQKLKKKCKDLEEENLSNAKKLSGLAKLLRARTDVPQTQLKRFINESPAPDSSLVPYTPEAAKPTVTAPGGENDSEKTKRQRCIGLTSPINLLERIRAVEDSPLNVGKKAGLRGDWKTHGPSSSRSVLSQPKTSTTEMHVFQNMDTNILRVKSNPFAVKKSKDKLAYKFDPEADVVTLC